MGSPTKDFVLGFIPLQVKRRATGTGGTYDATGADELTQLQRLIDVGVITGITSPDDIKPLEESQGARKPRKTASAEGDEHDRRRRAQGAGVHARQLRPLPQPARLPQHQQARAGDKLNFLPDDKDGGIFEFPFERYEPDPLARRRQRHPDPVHHAVAPRLPDHDGRRPDADRQRQEPRQRRDGSVTYTPKFYPDTTGRACADDCRSEPGVRDRIAATE